VGRGRCSVVDTYWQTETGGHIATNFPGTHLILRAHSYGAIPVREVRSSLERVFDNGICI
jgi:acyl-coenzyme A synthetase/AMP-(fatty) acid ligase